MNFISFLLIIIFLIFGIENNTLLSPKRKNLYEERIESYQDCIKLKIKAPNLNLKCEHLLDDFILRDTKSQKTNKIKTLLIDSSNTRKVNKMEEIKLRKLVQVLSNKKQ